MLLTKFRKMIKKILLIAVLFPTLCLSQNFNVPDANFEQVLIDLGIDTTSATDQIDGVVNLSIAVTGTKKLDLWNKRISDLTGIENFTSLEWLEADFNNLTEINLSNNTNLERLIIDYNNLTSLDLSGLNKLNRLNCQNNQLTSLNLPINSSLDFLECGANKLTTLDLSNSNLLTTLNCGNNLLTTLNVNSCPLLKDLDAGESPIELLILDKCTVLEKLACRDCNLENLDLSSNPNLQTVNLQSNVFFKTLNLKNGNLSAITSLNVTFCPYLTCIEVDDVTVATNQYFTYAIDSHISFNTDCPLEQETVNIPDANFEQHLIDIGIDIDGIINGEILKAYAEDITNLSMADKNISSLSGIEEFTSLRTLRAHQNNLTSVDLSNNLELTTLILALNQLTSIDLSNNIKLEEVMLQTNNLVSINIKNGTNTLIDTASDFIIDDNPNLTCVIVDDINYSTSTWTTKDIQTEYNVTCSSTNIINIPDSNFEQALIDENIDSDGVINEMVLASDIETITFLDVNSKNISDLTGIEGFTALETLFVHNNNLETVDVSANTKLTGLVLAINNLSSINISQNTNLVSLSLNENNISSIDLSANTNLTQVYIDDNQLTTIDLSQLDKLEELSVANNNLARLEINKNNELRILNCSLNQITALNTLSNVNLENLNCERNNIEYLDLSQNSSLTQVACNDNALIGLNIKNGANTSITNSNFSAFANPQLTCVEVDDINYSNTNWAQIDMQTNYSLSCIPVNDNCSYTTPIILGQDTPGNTSSATGSSNNPNCLQSGLTAFDIWYSFPAPSSGSITMTISAGTLVGKVALYGSCEDVQPLYCAVNELVVNGLIPNKTYYLQVWLEFSVSGKANTTSKSLNESGEFVINVQDSSVLSTTDVQESKFDFSVYPNPAQDFITIKSRNTISSIEVFTLSGQKLLHEKTTSNNTTTIDVKSFNSGLYLLKINSETKSYTKKLVIK